MDQVTAIIGGISQQEWIVFGILVLLVWLVTWLFTRSRGNRKVDAAQARTSEVESKLRRVERELTDGQDQVKRLQSNLVSSDDELSSLRKKIAQAEAEMQTLNDDKAALQSTVEAREGEIARMREQSAAMQGEIERLSQGAAAELQVVKANMENVAAERTALAELNTGLQAELDRVRGEYVSANTEVARARDRSDAVEKTISSKDTALSEAYQRAVVLQRQLQQREEQAAAAEGELEILRGEVTRLSHLQEDMERRLERSRADVAGELATLTSTMIKMKESALNDANARIAQLEAELAGLRAGK
jgi:predicted  nucleic acid-binding Zn-ribbon protein